MGEAAADCAGLDAGELNRWIFKGMLGAKAQRAVVWAVCDRSSCNCFGRLAVSKQLPRADEIGPAAAWIVRQPKAVRAEDP